MASINKNFVIKNGLEVDTKTLYVDAATKRVGIGSTIPTVDLDVVGKVRVQDGINTPNLVVGVTTAGTIGVSTLTATNVNVSVAATITTLQASSFTVTGNSTIGDASSDTVALNAEVTTNIIPSTTDISDFGSTTKRWRDIHIARNINASTLVGLGLSVGVGTVTRINGTTLNYSGIATVGFLTATHLSVTGVSTFINGPVLIGAATSTGTATQRLQVTGDAYVSGNLGIGTTAPNELLEVVGNIHVSGADRSIFNRSNNALSFGTNNIERARIDSSGRLLVGTSTALTTKTQINFALTPILEVASTTGSSSAQGLYFYGTAGASSGNLVFSRSNDTTVGSHTVIGSGARMGGLIFNGSDGDEFIPGADIFAASDAAAANNSMPGRLVFSTTADGASSPVERMRLNSAGNLLIGNTTGTDTLSVTGTANVSTSVTTTNSYSDGVVAKDTKTDGMMIAGGIDLPGTTTNLHLYSQTFSTGWVSGNANATLSVDSGVVAPDGTTGVGKFVCTDTTSVSRRLYPTASISISSGTQYTYSVYVKSINWPIVRLSFSAGATVTNEDAAASFDLVNGIKQESIGTGAVMSAVGNGWWRLSVTTTSNDITGVNPKIILNSTLAGNSAQTTAGIVDAGVYVWGAQLTPVPAGQTTALGPYIRTEENPITNSSGYIKINGTKVIGSPSSGVLDLTGSTIVSNIVPTTVSYGSSFVVASQETEPRDVVFSNDGKTMYVVGNIGNDITYYTLSTPWSITSASFVSQFSVGSQLTVPLGMYFKPDGTKFYVVGTTGVGAAATAVNQYTCGTPWDLTTASYDSVAFSVNAQDTNPNGIEFKPDGTKFYVIGNANDTIYQYSCSTPWNVSTASYDSVSFSVLAQENNVQKVRFSSDGTKFLVVGFSGDDINYYTLTTPWNASTASFVGIITSLSSVIGETAPSGLYWKPDGTKLYACGFTNDTVYEFSMTSNADLEVIGETKLYGDVEVHQDLKVYGEQSNYENAYFYNKVGIGTTNPTSRLHIQGTTSVGGIYVEDNNSSLSSPAIRVTGKRSDGNGSPAFGGKLVLDQQRTDAAFSINKTLGSIIFGANYDTTPNFAYPASITAVASAGWTSTTDASTDLVFYTDSTGQTSTDTANVTFGTERLRINSGGAVLIGSATSTGTATQPLQVTGGAYVSGNLGIGITNPTSRLHVVGDVLITGITTSTDFNSSSDIRLKENVKPIDNSLSKLSDLTGVSFVWKKTGSPSIGVIAQDVEKVFPELVGGFESKTVNYNGLIGVLIEAVKELSNEVNELKKKINN